MDAGTVDAYLARIGQARPDQPSDAALRELQASHLWSVPFENLAIHLGEPIVLDETAVIDKLLVRRRGGFCYELNGAFALLLRALGFDVSLLGASVFAGDDVGPPLDHMVLRVETGRSWLVDVGFGDHSVHPLDLDDPGLQIDPAGTFQISAGPHDAIDVARDGAPQYRVDMRPYRWADFEPMCWWQQTSPRSHFTRSLICTLATPSGRVTLSDRRLIRTEAGVRTEEVLVADEEVLASYRDTFGIVLDRLPRVERRS